MRPLVFTLLLCLSISGFAASGVATSANGEALSFEDGMQAYDRGHFLLAESIWLSLAEEGDASSQFFLGVLYEIGPGRIVRDQVAAVGWYQKAAEQGQVTAQLYLGNAYSEGRGTRRDQARAQYWWRQAAAQGSMRAQQLLLDLENVNPATSIPPADENPPSALEKTEPQYPSTALQDFKPVGPKPRPGTDKSEQLTAHKSSAGNPDGQPRTATPGNAPSWLQRQEPTHYTIQLSAVRSAKGFADFIARHGLEGKTQQITTSKKHSLRYFLVLGSYPSLQAANSAIASLSPALRAVGPWPRQIAELQSLTGE